MGWFDDIVNFLGNVGSNIYDDTAVYGPTVDIDETPSEDSGSGSSSGWSNGDSKNENILRSGNDAIDQSGIDYNSYDNDSYIWDLGQNIWGLLTGDPNLQENENRAVAKKYAENLFNGTGVSDVPELTAEDYIVADFIRNNYDVIKDKGIGLATGAMNEVGEDFYDAASQTDETLRILMDLMQGGRARNDGYNLGNDIYTAALNGNTEYIDNVLRTVGADLNNDGRTWSKLSDADKIAQMLNYNDNLGGYYARGDEGIMTDESGNLILNDTADSGYWKNLKAAQAGNASPITIADRNANQAVTTRLGLGGNGKYNALSGNSNASNALDALDIAATLATLPVGGAALAGAKGAGTAAKVASNAAKLSKAASAGTKGAHAASNTTRASKAANAATKASQGKHAKPAGTIGDRLDDRWDRISDRVKNSQFVQNSNPSNIFRNAKDVASSIYDDYLGTGKATRQLQKQFSKANKKSGGAASVGKETGKLSDVTPDISKNIYSTLRTGGTLGDEEQKAFNTVMKAEAPGIKNAIGGALKFGINPRNIYLGNAAIDPVEELTYLVNQSPYVAPQNKSVKRSAVPSV